MGVDRGDHEPVDGATKVGAAAEVVEGVVVVVIDAVPSSPAALNCCPITFFNAL
jgi:hypothetical protein